MSLMKVDLLFRQQSNKNNTTPGLSRVGGWSEGFYLNADVATALPRLIEVCKDRAPLLTTAAEIVGQRVRVVGGGSSTYARKFPGTFDQQADIPQMALLLTANGVGEPNTRRFTLRGIADARVIEGEFSGTAEFNRRLQIYATELQTQLMAFKCQSLSAPQANVLTISATGAVILEAPQSFFAEQMVQGLRVMSDDNNDVITFTAKAVSGVDSAHYTLVPWTYGPAHGGRLRLIEKIYPVIAADSVSVVKITTHKVGRDFFQYRGRQSKKS